MTELFASNLVTIGGPLLLGLILIVAFLCSIYKVADVDKALVITGGKEPVIKVSGGSFVIPIFRKASYFDLCMLTVSTDSDEIKTKTSVPIIVDWTAQIRPTTKDVTVLKKAIVSFKIKTVYFLMDVWPNGNYNRLRILFMGIRAQTR